MVFTQRDIERHRQRKKEVSGLYSNSVLYNMEMPVDRVTETLFDRLSGFAETGETIEICDWLHYFAFDAIGVFTVCTRISSEQDGKLTRRSSLAKPLASFRPAMISATL